MDALILPTLFFVLTTIIGYMLIFEGKLIKSKLNKSYLTFDFLSKAKPDMSSSLTLLAMHYEKPFYRNI